MVYENFLKDLKLINELENIDKGVFILTDYQKVLFEIISLTNNTEVPDIIVNDIIKTLNIDINDILYKGYIRISNYIVYQFINIKNNNKVIGYLMEDII